VTSEAAERIIERTNEPAFIVDPTEDRFVAANDAACTMLGYTREQLLATPVSAVHRGELVQLQNVVAEVLRRGHAMTDALTWRASTGECVPVEMALSALELEGRVLVIGLARDRSGHRR
jgi:hypothetical protein